MIRFVEVPMPWQVYYDQPDYTEPDAFYCSMGEHCCAEPAAPVGVHLSGDDDRPSWHTPFTPEGADPSDTSQWVCEDCSGWIEDMWAMRELFVGLP